tara:strand:- start:285 stop:1166 length:882 start_codon:yes stop_codon:yes gene_type:complete
MKPHTLLYHFQEALKGFRHGGVLSMATITTVAISLTILGGFLLFQANINQWVNHLENQLEISFYLKESSREAEIRRLMDQLENDPRVRDFKVISREQALLDLGRQLGEDSVLLEDLESNPLPDSIQIQLKPLDDFREFEREYTKFEAIDGSSSGQDWVQSLMQLISLSRSSGLAMLLLLGLANLIIIGNAIRLTVFARRQEIEIMRLVGASNWFIRAPFLIEGVIQGLLGALMATVILAFAYGLMHDRLLMIFPNLDLITYSAELIQLYLRLIFLGIALGFLGSLLSLRKFLV